MATSVADRTAVLLILTLLLLITSLSLEAVTGSTDRDGDGDRGMFILGKLKRVVRTDGGEVKLVSGYRWKGDPNPMHIGIVHMEPETLFIPQYIDANLILFVCSGEANIAYIYKDKLVKRNLRDGDVIVIPSGSAFYLANHLKDKTLHIIGSIEGAESLGYDSFQSFFIGGGTYPTSILAGFDQETLSAAFNVTIDDLAEMMTVQNGGPIVRMISHGEVADIDIDETKLGAGEIDGTDPVVEDFAWTWRKLLLGTILDSHHHHHHHHHHHRRSGRKELPVQGTHTYNLFDSKPSFENEYGSSIAIDKHDYFPLKHTGVGVYYVKLTAGSMLAPHLNPTATEYGIVLRGSGTIQVAFPNGTAATNAKVAPGDVFWIPRYFPFCQVASSSGPLEFFGFTTSSRRNRPQFLAGRSSVLRRMRGPELAGAFGMSEDRLDRLVKAQHEDIILPLYPKREREKKKVSMREELFGTSSMRKFA